MKCSSFVITLIFGLTTLVQFITQIFITRLFGATHNLDLFLMASTIPTALITVIYGTLNDAFAPQLGKHLKEKNHISYLLSHAFSLGLISFIASIVLIVVSPILTTLFYPFLSGTSRIFTYVAMSSMLISIPLGILATMFGSYWYLKGELYRFPLAQFIGGIAQLVTIRLLYNYVGVGGLVVGFVMNIFVHVLFTAPSVSIANKLSFSFIFPKGLLLSWIPLMIGNLFFRSDTLLIRSFGSHLSEGTLVYLNLASRMFNLSAGLITIGIQITVFPHFVQLFHNHNIDELKKFVSKVKLWSILATVFITGIMFVFTPILIKIFFIGGQFTPLDAQNAILLIPYFIFPAIGWGIAPVFLQPLSAIGKQITSGKIQILGGVSGWILASVVNQFASPLISISIGIATLLFVIVVGSHISWKQFEKKL